MTAAAYLAVASGGFLLDVVVIAVLVRRRRRARARALASERETFSHVRVVLLPPDVWAPEGWIE